jgi:hypothetical protein
MTPAQEKARELVLQFMIVVTPNTSIDFEGARICAIKSIDEMLNVLPEGSIDYSIDRIIGLYKQIKQEINNL